MINLLFNVVKSFILPFIVRIAVKKVEKLITEKGSGDSKLALAINKIQEYLELGASSPEEADKIKEFINSDKLISLINETVAKHINNNEK